DQSASDDRNSSRRWPYRGGRPAPSYPHRARTLESTGSTPRCPDRYPRKARQTGNTSRSVPEPAPEIRVVAGRRIVFRLPSSPHRPGPLARDRLPPIDVLRQPAGELLRAGDRCQAIRYPAPKLGNSSRYRFVAEGRRSRFAHGRTEIHQTLLSPRLVGSSPALP